MINIKKLILSAGMPRSGSTWMYNTIRILILNQYIHKEDFTYGWIEDIDKLPPSKIRLIKIHNHEENIVNKSDIIFYSYRDIRDAIASSFRKFGTKPSIKLASQFIEQHFKWEKISNYTMRYETMLKDKEKIVMEIANVLNIKSCSPQKIINQIENMNYNSNGKKNEIYNMDNLFHRDHITDGRHGSWRDTLSESFIKEIENKYSSWLNDYGYPLSDDQ